MSTAAGVLPPLGTRHDIDDKESKDINPLDQSTGIVPIAVAASTTSSLNAARLPFLSSLPIRVDVKIPILSFRLKDLLGLQKGTILKTNWSLAGDLPVAAGTTRLLWAEFAVADQQLTVRVTRVA